MIGNRVTLTTYNFFRKKKGQRDTVFLFFYLFPHCSLSKTTSQVKVNLHLGWLFWSLTITILKDYDTKRRIPRK
jgi:hypothetical protein